MKVVTITRIRHEVAAVIRGVQECEEPVLIVQRSMPVAYLVSVAQFEALQAELRQFRRANLLRDVAEAEAEVQRGGLPVYQEAGKLMADLLEEEEPAGNESESLDQT